jgi:hypothetical protein
MIWFPSVALAGLGHHMNRSAPAHKQVEPRDMTWSCLQILPQKGAGECR